MLRYATPKVPPATDLRQILENLYQERTLQPYRSGKAIPMGDSEIWLVCRGVVQLVTSYPNGEEAILGLACPSMPFGWPLTFIYPYRATALTDVGLMSLTLTELEQSPPQLTSSIFHQLSQRLQQTEALLALVGHCRVEDRLRQLLLLLKQEIGQPVDQGTRLSVRLTHQHLANAISTTRVTVTRLMGKLQQEGWLVVDKQRHIIIPDHLPLMQS